VLQYKSQQDIYYCFESILFINISEVGIRDPFRNAHSIHTVIDPAYSYQYQFEGDTTILVLLYVQITNKTALILLLLLAPLAASC
jgi:hypothetical protein